MQVNCNGNCRVQCAGKFCINFLWNFNCVCVSVQQQQRVSVRVCLCVWMRVRWCWKNLSLRYAFSPPVFAYLIFLPLLLYQHSRLCVRACMSLCVWVRSLLSFFNSLFIFTYSLFGGPRFIVVTRWRMLFPVLIYRRAVKIAPNSDSVFNSEIPKSSRAVCSTTHTRRQSKCRNFMTNTTRLYLSDLLNCRKLSGEYVYQHFYSKQITLQN